VELAAQGADCRLSMDSVVAASAVRRGEGSCDRRWVQPGAGL